MKTEINVVEIVKTLINTLSITDIIEIKDDLDKRFSCLEKELDDWFDRQDDLMIVKY